MPPNAKVFAAGRMLESVDFLAGRFLGRLPVDFLAGSCLLPANDNSYPHVLCEQA